MGQESLIFPRRKNKCPLDSLLKQAGGSYVEQGVYFSSVLEIKMLALSLDIVMKRPFLIALSKYSRIVCG